MTARSSPRLDAQRAATRTKGRAVRARHAPATSPPVRRPHVVVTAGPTREYIDPVRYLSNESSGRMGFAIAACAARAGHRVTLVAGPVHLPTPIGVERIDVVSARDMLRAAARAARGAEALYMAAAVADFRPRTRRAGKWKKKEGSRAPISLDLVHNPDILATLARRRSARLALIVGFALETSDGVRRARSKLARKGADYIVLNDASALNAERASVIILARDGSMRRVSTRAKDAIAQALVDLLPVPGG